MGYDPSGSTSITATANWDQPNDADLHALLPTGNTYSAPTEALPGYPLQISEPFFPDVSGAHIYPNHYESQINGGVATATHSGDSGGGLAPYPGQPGCDPAIQSSVTCEAIAVQGEVPSGVYSYALHAFPASGSSFPLTNFSLDVRASGNMVLVTNTPNVINPITGLIQQTGSFQGAGATTSQLDVFALNVGHAGHVGGVTIPQMEAFSVNGLTRYQPAEPLLFDETPSIQDQIAGAFTKRLNEIADLNQQKQDILYATYLASIAHKKAQQIPITPTKNDTYCGYDAGGGFLSTFKCSPNDPVFFEPKKIVATPEGFAQFAQEKGVTLGNPSNSGAGALADGTHNFEITAYVKPSSNEKEVGFFRQSRENEYEQNSEAGAAQAYNCMYSDSVLRKATGCTGALYQALVRTSMHVGDFLIIDAFLTAEDCLLNGGWVDCGSTVVSVVPIGKVVKIVKKTDGVFEAVVESSDEVIDFVDDKIDNLDNIDNISYVRTSNGTADAISGVKLTRSLLLDEITEHSFYKHVLDQGEFQGLGIRTIDQFKAHVDNVIDNASSIRYYPDGRVVYLQESTGTVVVWNKANSGPSTAFQPENWTDYISDLPQKTTPYP